MRTRKILLAALLVALAAPAAAQTTVISRLKLTDPDLHYPGGAGLKTLLDNMWIKTADSLDSRYFEITGLANAGTTDLDHNFKTAFSTLRVDLYLWNTGTGELTLLTATSTPAITSFTIAATPGLTTTKTRITNSSGSSRDLVAVIHHDATDVAKLHDASIVSPVDGQVLTYVASSSTWQNKPSSGGGGGAGGAAWYPPAGTGALVAEENGQQVYLFPDATDVELDLWFQVASSYIAGNQITVGLGAYSPSTSNAYVLATTSYLVRAGTDAVSSTTNSQAGTATFTNGSPANRLVAHSLNVTDGSGLINSVAVSAGDMIHIVLTRNYASGSDTDTADVRFVPGSTSVRLSP